MKYHFFLTLAILAINVFGQASAQQPLPGNIPVIQPICAEVSEPTSPMAYTYLNHSCVWVSTDPYYFGGAINCSHKVQYFVDAVYYLDGVLKVDSPPTVYSALQKLAETPSNHAILPGDARLRSHPVTILQ